MNKLKTTLALGAAFAACGGDDTSDVLEGVDSIVFLQRKPGNSSMGDIFQNLSYQAGAKLVKLTPPTADGTLETLCCDHLGAEFENMDINGYDISFDATEIVFSAKLNGNERYGLFVLDLASQEVEQLPTNPNSDYIYPIYVPGDRIMFNTNAVVEEGAPQFRDEYNRGTTTQLGTIRRSGEDEILGARNLSHRIHGSLMSDGRVIATQWDHLGGMNAGHLVTINPDLTVVREAFGKEGRGVTNSYYKAVEISPGRVVAIGSSRDKTVQSGTILDIRLGESYEQDGIVLADLNMAERNSRGIILTPDIPLGNEDAPNTVGRYFSAYPLNAAENPTFVVSWSDGPVQSETLSAAGLTAQFGVYLFDSKTKSRRPIWDDPDMWDLMPRPLVARAAPPEIAGGGTNQFSDDAVLIGAMNVYESSLDEFASGSIYGVRVIEGFSVEEGIPTRDFGLTRHEGAALLGTAVVRDDGSWAAQIPANVPVHLQVVDKFGMSLRSEPVWISGNAGESRFCGGCHEDRAATTVIQPGITEAVAFGPDDLKSAVGRYERVSSTQAMAATVGAMDSVVGVPWDVALQPIFDARCVSCHEGTAGAANPSYSLTDPATGMSQTITFDLRGTAMAYGTGDEMIGGYTASHLSLLGPDMMELEDAGLIIEGDMKIYVDPESARDSELIRIINPVQVFQQGTEGLSPNVSVRAFADAPVLSVDHQNLLTPEEQYLFTLMADMGGQFYSRENKDNSYAP